MTGTWIDETTGELAIEDVIEAGLVATDAGVDFITAILCRLLHEESIGEKRPRHRHHVGIAARQHVLCHFRCVDAIGGNHGYRQMLTEFCRYPGECGTWHLG